MTEDRGGGSRKLWRRADRVLDDLLTLPPDQRDEALDLRRLEPELERCVRRLLDAGRIEDGVLDRPVERVFDEPAADAETSPGMVGRRFGQFELEEKIGQGGMSVVFRARRVEGGFDQQVAVKILTVAHLVTGDRIRQEKDILARLRHPHIATLVDGGVEADGTSWIAMELVDGEPIDRYCDRVGADARGVVGLMRAVCDAVAYAHRNLVVHRDIKPGNILVDGDGQVRLLDFGIAKLLDESDPEASHTRVFTPRYAAPEQIRGESLTTAADVFGLGGVLYRLLTRAAPRSAGSDSSPGGGATEAAIRPSRAPKPVPGIDRDLDTVVLKALREEPERRYPSASELREDLSRWLDRRPVRAMPDRLTYRVQKFVERHRALALSSVLGLLAVVIGTGATWWQAALAQEQAAVAVREAERASAVTDFLLDLFELAEPDRSQGETLTVRQALDTGARQLEVRLEDQPEVRIELLATVGEIYRRLGLYDEAGLLLDTAVALGVGVGGEAEARARLRRAVVGLSRFELEAAEVDLETPLASSDPRLRMEAQRVLGSIRQADGRFDEAEELVGRVLEMELGSVEPELESVAELRLAMADIVFETGDLDRSGELYRAALEASESAFEGDHTQIALAQQSFGVYATETGDSETGMAYLEKSLAMRERLLGESHPDVAFTLAYIAQIHRSEGRFDEAESRYRRALALQQERLGKDHPVVLGTLNSLSILAYDRGRTSDAAEMLDEVTARARRSYGEGHPVLADFLVNLAAIRRVLGHFDRAENHLQEALVIQLEARGRGTLGVGLTYAHLGNLERDRGNLADAEDYYRQSLESIREATGDTHPETLSVRANLGSVSFERGRYRESAEQFETAFSVARQALDEGHPIRTLIEARFARSLARAGRSDEAVLHAEKALEEEAAIYPEDHPRHLEIKAIRGGAQMSSGALAEGRATLREVEVLLDGGATSKAAADEIDFWRSRG